MHPANGMDRTSSHTAGVGESMSARVEEHPIIGLGLTVKPHGMIKAGRHHGMPVMSPGMRRDDGIKGIVIAQVSQPTSVKLRSLA
jgi:hypothetical protein